MQFHSKWLTTDLLVNHFNNYLTNPWEILMKFKISNFQANFSDWWLRHLLWNFPQMNISVPY